MIAVPETQFGQPYVAMYSGPYYPDDTLTNFLGCWLCSDFVVRGNDPSDIWAEYYFDSPDACYVAADCYNTCCKDKPCKCCRDRMGVYS